MRKDGEPHVFKRVKLKDLYNQIKNEDLTERSFKEWLKFYSYRHWGRGWNDGFDDQAKLQKLTDEEINKIYMEHGNKDWDWQIDFARAILRKAQEK